MHYLFQNARWATRTSKLIASYWSTNLGTCEDKSRTSYNDLFTPLQEWESSILIEIAEQSSDKIDMLHVFSQYGRENKINDNKTLIFFRVVKNAYVWEDRLRNLCHTHTDDFDTSLVYEKIMFIIWKKFSNQPL